QFEESKVSDSSGSDFILSDEIYSSDSNNDDVDFGEKQDPKQIQKSPKINIKKSLLRNLTLPLKTLYKSSRLFGASERILVKGKDTQWLIEYEEKFKNIKVKIPKFYNKSRKNLITIDDDETFEDYGLLYDDDLILLTKKLKKRTRSKGIYILSFNTQNKIYTKYAGYVTYMDNKELIEKIKQVFNNIGDSYIDKEQLRGKTFEEMIPYI
ncbi:13255_t:CDS:2, partial [Entrophospora sp. SA101]